MVEFAGIISKNSLKGMPEEIEQMLSVMSLPETDQKKLPFRKSKYCLWPNSSPN